MGRHHRLVGAAIAVAMFVAFAAPARPAHAVPVLQLYAEGATYDPVNESWVSSSPNFVLWVLGDTDGGTRTIEDVFLAVAYDSTETGSISITPTTVSAGELPAPGDSSTPIAPTFDNSGTGTTPVSSTGSTLSQPHGIYSDPQTTWETWAIGDFSLADSPIGDYTQGACPGPLCEYPTLGQINAYLIEIDGYSFVHFDAFDHYQTQNNTKYVFAPFSHDAETRSAPEPSSVVLLGLGLVGLGLFAHRRTLAR